MASRTSVTSLIQRAYQNNTSFSNTQIRRYRSGRIFTVFSGMESTTFNDISNQVCFNPEGIWAFSPRLARLGEGLPWIGCRRHCFYRRYQVVGDEVTSRGYQVVGDEVTSRGTIRVLDICRGYQGELSRSEFEQKNSRPTINCENISQSTCRTYVGLLRQKQW
jgi:hypothetical protein